MVRLKRVSPFHLIHKNAIGVFHFKREKSIRFYGCFSRFLVAQAVFLVQKVLLQHSSIRHNFLCRNLVDFELGINVSGNDIANGNSFKSYTGVKIGDTVETVMKLHNKQPDEILKSPYTDDPIFIYWTDSSKKTGIRYDISTGKVLSMSLNYNPHIRYFEGCG